MSGRTGLRIATISHGHPVLSPGGAEIASLTLHSALAQCHGVEALHLAAVPPLHPDAGRSHDQQYFAARRLHNVTLMQSDPTKADRLTKQLRAFEPDVIHLHHVLGIGADALFQLRQQFSHAVIVLTLHEFIAICHNQGQMMRTDGSVCERASPAACHACFPDIVAARFLRREQALRAMMSMVDGFIAPSLFLAQRYIEWGIPQSSVTVLENAVGMPARELKRGSSPTQKRGRFAFFGQLTPFKGVDLLLEAVAHMPEADWQGCSLEIFGANLEHQPSAFREKIEALIKRAGSRVTRHGAYQSTDLPELMSRADWVVVPSIWWENSPLVIQEAFSQGVPVIASAQGGMAEKVASGRDGLTFPAGDVGSLRATLVKASNPDVWAKMASGVLPPLSAQIIAAQHHQLYQSLLESRQRHARAVRLSITD